MTDETEEKKPAEVKKAEERKDFLAEARELAARNEKTLAEMRTLVERNEELAARNLLGGKTDAGDQPGIKKELTPKEYKDAVMRGEIPK